ncbi:MAG: MBL fold metallo-hydrolase [Hyphomonadaceae bacterium]
MSSRRSFLRLCACCAAASAVPALAFEEAAPLPTLTSLADGVWMHTTWGMLPSGPFPSNGMIVAGAEKVLVADTGWGIGPTRWLMARVGEIAGQKPVLLVVTHAHDDRMIGLPVAHEAGAESWASRLTQADAPGRGLPPAQRTWRGRRKRFDLGGRVVEAFYPGPAHTRDNCVVWDEVAGALFGGCMIRPLAMGLGNLADADRALYLGSVRRLISRYPRARSVVPGHGEPGGADLLAHTETLAWEAFGAS